MKFPILGLMQRASMDNQAKIGEFDCNQYSSRLACLRHPAPDRLRKREKFNPFKLYFLNVAENGSAIAE
jgi:hypothetical protein